MKLFEFFKKKPKQHVVIRNIQSNEIRLDEWRKTPGLVEEARKLFASPTWNLIKQVLVNESPVNYPIQGLGVPATDHLLSKGKVEGYHMALNNLEAFAKPSETDEPLEAKFEPEKSEPKE